QALWNAAQVGFLLLILCLWCVDRRWWVSAMALATLVCSPFGIYALSPGGCAVTALLLVTCARSWARGVRETGISIVDAPARGTPSLAKFEFLAFVCNLLCSMYNYSVNPNVWPHWGHVFWSLAHLIGFTPNLAMIDHAMYTLGLRGVSLPLYIQV